LVGVLDKPLSTKDSVGKSARAGGITGSFGFLGGFMGNVIFGARLDPSAMGMYYESFGVSIDSTKVMAVQVVG